MENRSVLSAAVRMTRAMTKSYPGLLEDLRLCETLIARGVVTFNDLPPVQAQLCVRVLKEYNEAVRFIH